MVLRENAASALAMPLLLEPGAERSHAERSHAERAHASATEVAAAHDALLEATGGFGRYQRRALLVAPPQPRVARAPPASVERARMEEEAAIISRDLALPTRGRFGG